MSRNSASAKGMTDKRDCRTNGICFNRAFALISRRVTGRRSGLIGARSTADQSSSVVGIAKVTGTAYRDPTAKEEDWSAVDLAPIKPLRRPVTLREIKANARLKQISLVRQSRLSVMPLAEAEFRDIVKLSAP